MIRDEYNKVEITNDKQVAKVEFGKTQATETLPTSENKVPDGDLNEKYVGKTIKKETEINVDYVNKVPTHATQTVVQSTTTATTAAAATATTAVAASTVAVVAIATVTGISVALHDYQYEFKSLIISSNELRYELYIVDAMQDEKEYFSYEDQDPHREEEYGFEEGYGAPFKLHVYNNDYDATQYIWYYSTNSGTFSNLTLGETYNIVLSENRYGGEEIYKDTFITYQNSAVFDFELYQYMNYREGSFNFNLDYVDDDDSISDLLLEFYEPEIPEETLISVSLEKMSGYQTAYAVSEEGYPLIELNREYGYRFSYVKNREKIVYKEDIITFIDYSGSKSEFNEFIFDKTANFIENSIEVRLDYVDDFNWFDNFVLKFTMIPSEQDSGGEKPEEFYSPEIPLESTNETQTIALNQYEIYARDDYFSYTYRLSCKYRGEETTLIEETTPFTFTDNSGGVSEFYGLEFKKEANFLTDSFKLRLDYQDDFGIFDNFQFHLLPNGVNAQYDFSLENTNEEQTLTFDDQQHWNHSFDYSYTYYLTYTENYEEKTYNPETEEFTFTDISGGVSEVRGITFTGRYEMSSGRAPVQLDYQDDFDFLSDFVLHLLGPIAEPGNGGDINPLRANENGANIDDYPYVIELEKTTDVQYINIREYILQATEDDNFIYALTYNYRGEEQEPIYSEQPIQFVDPDASSVVNGINFTLNEDNVPEANFNTRTFYVQIDFQDDYGYFSNFTLNVRDNENGGWVEKELQYTTDPQPVTIDEYDYDEEKYPVDIVSGKLTYNFTYVSSETGDPATQYFYDEEPSLTFANSLKSEFYGLETSFDFTRDEQSGECTLPFRFDMINDAEYFSVPELYITPTDDDNNILATISFQNETMHSGWQRGSFSPYNDFTIEELTNGDEYNLVVACYEKDGYDGAEQRNIKYCEAHSFTLNQKQEIYGANISNYLSAGSWTLSAELIYNGFSEMFTEGELILEDAEGNTYTYELPINIYTSVSLTSPKEATLTDDELEVIFANPVSVSIKYWTLKESADGTTFEKDQQFTINCLQSYQFDVSH